MGHIYFLVNDGPLGGISVDCSHMDVTGNRNKQIQQEEIRRTSKGARKGIEKELPTLSKQKTTISLPLQYAKSVKITFNHSYFIPSVLKRH